MAGYHNDQFFRLNSPNSGEDTTFTNIGNGTAGWAVRGADNPHFIYPDRTVRTEDHTGRHSVAMKRGYIRSLASYVNGAFTSVSKCQFQFNPSTLTQVVDAATSTLNYLALDPGQYAVPLSASVNFTFDLLFDRSMEINNARDAVPADGVNPWQAGDPGQVGVLRDLAAFYGVIGQSINQDRLELYKKQLIDSITSEAAGMTEETAQEDLQTAIQNAPAFLTNNAANSGFLLPIPVRVVFSSLYIVEGFVTNTTVAFTKFNTAMVPMQCALSVTMDAKYIGFAQKNTFLTWSLEQQAEAIQQEAQAEQDRVAAIYSAFATTAGKAEVELWDSSDSPLGTPEFFGYEGLLTGEQPSFKIVARLPSAKSGDAVGDLYGTATPPVVSLGASTTLYGPFPDLSQYRGPSLLSYAKTNGKVLGNGILIAGAVSGGVATSSSQWGNLSKGIVTGSTFPPRNSSFSGPLAVYDPDTAYYVVHYTATCAATIEGGTPISGTGELTVLYGPGSAFTPSVSIPLSWTQYVPPDTTTTTTIGSVPKDNAATAPKSAGTVSSVGSATTGFRT